MNTRRIVALAAAGAAVGAAGAGIYRATHPADARGPSTPDPGRRRAPLLDGLFDLPDGVIDHEIDARDGGVIHAIEKGTGQPLVLLHGITLRSDVWAPQFHHLTDRFRVIALDLRGHGGSRAGSEGFGLSRLAADLATLLEHLDLHDAIVVGHSMGGMTTMEFCVDHPDVLAERVAGLVFMATRAHQVFPPLVDGPLRSLVGRGQAMVDGGKPLPSRAQVNERLARLAFGQHPSPRAVAVVAEMGGAMDPAALVPSLDQMFDHDVRVALHQTRTPSLVMVGTRDLLTPVPSGRHLARLLPDCDLVVLPKAGHQLMQERPEEVDEIITAFADRIAGRAESLAEAVDVDPGPVTSEQVERPGDV